MNLVTSSAKSFISTFLTAFVRLHRTIFTVGHPRPPGGSLGFPYISCKCQDLATGIHGRFRSCGLKRKMKKNRLWPWSLKAKLGKFKLWQKSSLCQRGLPKVVHTEYTPKTTVFTVKLAPSCKSSCCSCSGCNSLCRCSSSAAWFLKEFPPMPFLTGIQNVSIQYLHIEYLEILGISMYFHILCWEIYSIISTPSTLRFRFDAWRRPSWSSMAISLRVSPNISPMFTLFKFIKLGLHPSLLNLAHCLQNTQLLSSSLCLFVTLEAFSQQLHWESVTLRHFRCIRCWSDDGNIRVRHAFRASRSSSCSRSTGSPGVKTCLTRYDHEFLAQMYQQFCRL